MNESIAEHIKKADRNEISGKNRKFYSMEQLKVKIIRKTNGITK
jgi:hypothetical protein